MFPPMRRLILALCLIAAPAAAELGGTGESTGTGEELAFVKAIFAEIQPRSIALNREICGYIGLNRLGRLVHTRHNIGEEASCRLPNWPLKMTVLASYHTHSTYSEEFLSELPSDLDLRSDLANDIDGYIATPGGRLWYVDTDALRVTQICAIGCLYQDPNFRAGPKGTVRESYSFDDIFKRMSR